MRAHKGQTRARRISHAMAQFDVSAACQESAEHAYRRGDDDAAARYEARSVQAWREMVRYSGLAYPLLRGTAS